ncbi:MAG: tetraacyldisaccharide 4'-kinase [Terracidiphilus sp.]|jgi:3-deoxy-D-manno-octulosonic-acid transferase
MILFFYNLALLAALVVGAPWWLWQIATTQKYREGLMRRLGRVTTLEGQNSRPLIWIHAVSVGEVLAVSRLVKELEAALPDHFVAISTTTRTGQNLARERFGAHRVFYCPLDLPWAVSAYLNALKPRLLVLAETEFWPNLLSGCYRREIPVAVVNARVSDRSWPRYRRLRWLWRPFLERISLVLAQSETDANRLWAIGCHPETVEVAGNLKFDVRAAEPAEATRVLKALKLANRLVVGGSTLEGEEAALLEAWPQLLHTDPRLVLVLAPRHPERFEAVAGLLNQSGYSWKRRSEWREQRAGSIRLLQPGEIVLLDSIGELASVYSLASAAFVGGSLFPTGGHNPLEPAQFGVPIVMGAHFANFRDITEDLISQQAIRIAEKEDLARVLIELLQDKATAETMGERAKRVFEQQSGATGRCVKALRALVSTRTVQPERDRVQLAPAFEIAPPQQINEESVQEQAVPAAPVQFDLVQSAPPQTRPIQPKPIQLEFFQSQPAELAAEKLHLADNSESSVTGHDFSRAASAAESAWALAPEGNPPSISPEIPASPVASQAKPTQIEPIQVQPVEPEPAQPVRANPNQSEPMQAHPVQAVKGSGFSPRKLLFPLVPAYMLANRLREMRLGTKAEPIRRLRYPVVSVGNLSTGGTGKTPLTIALADALTRCGFQVDVLSKGYGRRSQVAVRVAQDGSAEEFGDEPLLIARGGVPVYVASRRYDAGVLAEGDAAAIAFLGEELRPFIHLLDDGFQHRQLHRNVDILLLNRQDWQDGLLPSGNLRESKNAIRRASVVAIPADDAGLETELRSWGWQGPIWRTHRKMEVPVPSGSGARAIAAFCGIARPEQFFAGLEAAGLHLAVRKAFPDHHTYTAQEAEQLRASAGAGGATAIITTEKDFLRLGKLSAVFTESLPLETARLRVEIEHEDEAIEWLLERLPLSPSQQPL